MIINKTSARRARLLLGAATVAALANAPSALAGVSVEVTDKPNGKVSVTTTTFEPETVELLFDPQNPNDVLVHSPDSALVPSDTCLPDALQQKGVMRCVGMKSVVVDLGSGKDLLDTVGPVKQAITWIGDIGDDRVDLLSSVGNNVIDATPDVDNDLYRVSDHTQVSYAGRSHAVEIDLTKPAGDGDVAGGENDSIVAPDGGRFRLTNKDDLFTGADQPVTVEALGGSDSLVSSGPANTLDGGDGVDLLRGDGTLIGGADDDILELRASKGGPRVISGGTGKDLLKIMANAPGGARISLDGVANDGFAGETLNANIKADVDDVTTVANGDQALADVITGSAAANNISTGGGADTITPGGGSDTVSSGAGGDIINAIDGVKDTIDCGSAINDMTSHDNIDVRTGCELLGQINNVPPVDEPPVDEPPVDEPPVDEPPVDQPPVDQPPVDKPPVEQPPAQQPTATTATTPPPVTGLTSVITPPKAVKLSLSATVGKQKVKTLKRNKKLSLRVKVNKKAKVAFTLTLKRKGKAVKYKGKALKLGTVTKTVAGGKTLTVKVTFTKAGRKALRKGDTVAIRLVATAGKERKTINKTVKAR